MSPAHLAQVTIYALLWLGGAALFWYGLVRFGAWLDDDDGPAPLHGCGCEDCAALSDDDESEYGC